MNSKYTIIGNKEETQKYVFINKNTENNPAIDQKYCCVILYVLNCKKHSYIKHISYTWWHYRPNYLLILEYAVMYYSESSLRSRV